jgi:hypothetical protein
MLVVLLLLGADVPDVFPSGSATPEGAMADFARANIAADTNMLAATCLPASYLPESPLQRKYEQQLTSMAARFKEEAARVEKTPTWPETIRRVFKARHMSQGGPASLAYALVDLQDLLFVDVEVVLHNGEAQTYRNLAARTPKGEWRVVTYPPLFMPSVAALFGEPASTEECKLRSGCTISEHPSDEK